MMLAKFAFMVRAHKPRLEDFVTRSMMPIRSLLMKGLQAVLQWAQTTP